MAQMLQAAGVPPSRLDAVGRGEADPIGDNSTAQGRAQNRRVEITVAE
jgi:type VI secretion system protein ImpK